MAKIKYAVVFGTSGNEAIFVTTDDNVYALGTNCSGCLGLGDAQNYLQPRKIDILCNTKIDAISCGSGPHVLAVTEDGKLFAWGHNGYCQLGNGSTNQLLTPAACITNLMDRQVVQVACGGHHSMVLTKEGEVFVWGQNNSGQVGSGNTANQPTPLKICAGIGTKVVMEIACAQSSSYAVTRNGEVFAWGYNGNGQMGLGNNLNQSSPNCVESLKGCFVQSVVCGFGHTMVLTDEGLVLSWGANSYGQLGIGSKTNAMTPTKIVSDVGKFVEIGSVHYSNISGAMTETGVVYAWGLCRGQSVLLPMATCFEHINDVFALLSTPAVTCRPLQITVDTSLTVQESIALSFNDPLSSDITFIVDGKTIHAHKSLLKIRCQHFNSMFQDYWQENNLSEIVISDYKYPVYNAFLEFLYTDRVQLGSEDALGLLDLANAYCEDNLKRKCELLIRNGVTVDNVLYLYSAAIKYNAPKLEEYCFRFATNHLTTVSQTDAIKDLDESTLKEFIRKAGSVGAFKF